MSTFIGRIKKVGKKKMNISVISYNVCLFISPPLRFNGAFTRSTRLAKTLYNSIPDPSAIDIICFQEFIVHRQQMLKDLYLHPFHTEIDHGSMFGDNIRFLESGLTIVSKYPIVEQKNHIFKGKSYHFEAFVCKSVQYAKIKINTQYIHVLNQHSQAWVEGRQIRMNQFKQIAEFYLSLNIPKHEPVILCGDFNFDFYEQSRILYDVMSIVDFTMHLPLTPQFSFDPTMNQLVSTDDPSQYCTQSFINGCYDQFMETGICNCCPKQLIDGICTSNQNIKPISAQTQVIQNILPEPFEIYINVSTKRKVNVISDHFPILCKLIFPLNPDIDLNWIQKPIPNKTSNDYWGWVVLEFVFFIFLYGMFVLIVYLHSKRKRTNLITLIK